MRDLIMALRRGAVDEHRCLGCEFEDDCGIHGCQVMKKAADLLDRQREQTILTVAEQQAIFRLGQMDMQQSAVQMLRNLADGLLDSGRAMMLVAADCVESMDVSGSDTGGGNDGKLGN